jgi:hypothetical protein
VKHVGDPFILKMNNMKHVEPLKNMRVLFTECEHDGDLQNYIGDIVKCGGHIVDSKIFHEEEECYVSFLVSNTDEFMEKFKLTDSYEAMFI